jgi:hypothetical protein
VTGGKIKFGKHAMRREGRFAHGSKERGQEMGDKIQKLFNNNKNTDGRVVCGGAAQREKFEVRNGNETTDKKHAYARGCCGCGWLLRCWKRLGAKMRRRCHHHGRHT